MGDVDDVPGDILSLDEPGPVREAEALALTDRVEPVPLVPAQHSPGLALHDLPLPLPQVVPDEIAVRDLSQEADPLAVSSVLVRKVDFPSEPPDLGLLKPAEGEEGARDLLLAQAREEVRLVLHGIDPALE